LFSPLGDPSRMSNGRSVRYTEKTRKQLPGKVLTERQAPNSGPEKLLREKIQEELEIVGQSTLARHRKVV
jgi:hypothetical protein